MGCGQHPVAPIGLFGGVTRVDGKTVPSYTIVAGGCLTEGDSTLAAPIAKIPAKAIPHMLKQFFTAAQQNLHPGESLTALMKRWGTSYLAELAPIFEHIPSFEDAPEYYRDFD